MNPSTQVKTPHALGFRMPAEWEPHEATWLGWPHEVTDWPGKFAPIPWAFAEIVRHLSQVEHVYLLVENRAAESRVRTILKNSGANLGAVDFFRLPTDRGWMRDSGPVCVRNETGEVAYNHFTFNGWAKYSNHKKDAAVVAKANQKLKRRVWEPVHKGGRDAANHRRMSAQQRARKKSGIQERRLRASLPRIFRRDEYSLAEKRNRRRRHPRPRGRSRVIREPVDGRDHRGG